MVRNRGRLRDPDNSPLRDGNRDVLYGILTRRAARTLVYYLTETNQNMAQWLVAYFHKNPIPDKGRPEEVSGDDFLRSLLCMGEQRLVNPYTQESLTIDPRSIAQRIMDIRVHLAKEWQEDLKWCRDENADMLRESLLCSLKEQASPDGRIDDDGRPLP